MKTSFILDIHSVLDVITNSSSELFVISDTTTVKAVEDLLEFMLEKYNEMAEKGIFGKWRENFVPLKMENTMYVRFLSQEEVDNEKNETYKWGYETDENVGKIVIQSEGDNSIPWEIIEWIESAFSSRKWHLG